MKEQRQRQGGRGSGTRVGRWRRDREGFPWVLRNNGWKTGLGEGTRGRKVGVLTNKKEAVQGG